MKKTTLILNLAWLFLAFLFVCKVGYISKSIDNLANEVKRLSFAVGAERAFGMESAERAIRQAELDRKIAEMKRCVNVKFDGETPEQFLERTRNCPQE